MEERNNKEKGKSLPSFVSRDGVSADKKYVEWLSEVKARFSQSQIKAAIRVNTSMLQLYWSIGRDLVDLHAEERWGSGIVKQFALDMRQAFPDQTGFSHTNIKYMKRWYLFYYQYLTIGHQLGDQLEMPETFGIVPWKHHVYIISKCKTLEEALFYIDKVVTEGWSRAVLEHHVDAKLFETQGAAITNFNHTLPSAQISSANQLLKKEYDLSFISAEEIKKEKDLENALANNITQFLLELGSGFSYVGRQMELQMPGGQVFFPDLVFYHIPQHRFVVVELKAIKFIPEFVGKLNFYVTAVDKLLKGEADSPTIGLLICKSTDRTIVEWSLQDIQKPLGIATYQLQQIVERTIAEIESKGE